VSPTELARLWAEQEGRDPPFTAARVLAEMKKTAREKDYPFIGELARRMTDPRERLLYSRSADDLIALARRHPEIARTLAEQRPLLARVGAGRRALAEAIQLEMLDLMERDERRLAAYGEAATAWAEVWPALVRALERLPLREAHARIVAEAAKVLPRAVPEEPGS
jgi:hypothetical protein